MSSPTAMNTAKDAFRDIRSLCARLYGSPRGVVGALAFAGLALGASCSSDDKSPRDPGTGGALSDSGTGGSGGGSTGGSGGVVPGSGGSGGTPIEAGGGSGGGGGGAPDAAVDAEIPDAAPDGPVGDAGCPAGAKPCDGACVSVDDPAFGCTESGCAPCTGADNTEARCENGACEFAGCSPGFADCNGTLDDGCEASLLESADHCSACGNVCRLPHATAECDGGVCRVAACAPGFDDCDGEDENGCEAEVANDPAHCGDCSKTCTPTPGASARCTGGTCGEMICPIGLADCDGSPGCETNLSNDEANCGACGRTCAALPNATGVCVGGVCSVDECEPGFEDCDGIPGNGCEVEVATNALHCGACNRACETSGASSARCEDGECFQICDHGTGDCTHPQAPAADDGCETDTASDVTNCGACGVVCSSPTGTLGCSDGGCVITDCPEDTGDCDGDVDNGCETDIRENEDHCGACGRACSSANATVRLCANAVCVSGCVPGFGNCTAPAAPEPDDGCETATDSNPEHCGACGRACSGDNVAVASCSAGVCDSSCERGFGNCVQPTSDLPDDGCETPVNTDTRCGSCDNDCTEQGGGGSGLRCTASLTCGCAGNAGRCNVSGASGTCSEQRCVCGGVTCQPGEECSGLPAPDHCTCNGASACPAGTVCCQTPAGCADLATDEASCGACGHACPPGYSCEAGTCVAP